MAIVVPTLDGLLGFDRGDLDEEVDLRSLSFRVAEVFGDKAELAKAYLQYATGKMKLGALGLHLLEVQKHDSAVRDIQTTGHLAKFLSRLDVFIRTSDYGIVGMPNALFDELSQSEREKYFKRGGILVIEGDFLGLPEVQSMLNREREILARFSSGEI